MYRAVPLVLIAAGLIAAYALGLQQVISFAWLSDHWRALEAMVSAHPAVALACFFLLYATLTTFSMPGGSVLSVAGGSLFGIPAGAAGAVVGATSGAVLLFLATRSALAGWFARRAGPLLERLRPGLERDGFTYIVALRLLPVMPFPIVNIAAGLVGVKLRTFAVATFFGLIPATVVFASVGAGLATVLADGGRVDAATLLRPSILLPLLALALLSLSPIAVRSWQVRSSRSDS